MIFLVRDSSFLYSIILSFFVSLYLIIQQDILIGIIIIILNLIFIAKKYKYYKQHDSTKDGNISIKKFSSCVSHMPMNITVTDKNDNPISTNIKNRIILETVEVKSLFDNPNIDNSGMSIDSSRKIIKVKVNENIKQYLSYKENILDKKQQIIGYAHIECDITDMMKYQESLADRNQILEFLGSQLEAQMNNEVKNRLDKQRKYQDLLDNNRDGILVFGYNYSEKQILGFIDSNYVIKNIISYNKRELKSINIYDLFHISEKDRVEIILKNMVSEKPILFETLMVNDKKVFPVEINAHLCKIYGQDSMYLSIRNISLRKELELKRDRNRILAIKNNKMALIIYLLHILYARVGKSIKIIKEQTKIIDSYLLDSKNETKEIIVNSELIDKTVTDLIVFYTPANIKAYIDIKALLENIQQTIFFKEIINNTVITFIQKGEVNEVYCDEDAIKYVLITIIDNSLQSINAQRGTNFYGKIDITIQELNNNYILITIEDNAGGIDENIIGRVFDAFYSSKNYSVGLGLPTCKVIVEEILFGTIQIANIREGVKIDIQIAK